MADFMSTAENVLRDSDLAREIAELLKLDDAAALNLTAETTLSAESLLAGFHLDRATTEAIIKRFGRPVINTWNGTFDPPRSKVWRERLEVHREPLETAIPSVGRIEVRDFGVSHLGTAWMITEDVAVTNRHVALLFARRGLGAFPIQRVAGGRELTVVIDFLAEADNPRSLEHRVEEVLFIAADEEPDIAFLRVARSVSIPPPLEISEDVLGIGQMIVTVGYPAYDDRNRADDQQRIFGGVFNIKRIAPGEIMQVLGGTEIAHDATTLGGNSGSAVLDPVSGKVVGLHFSGKEGLTNWAVSGSQIRKYFERYVLGSGASVPVLEAPVRWADEEERRRWVEDLSDRRGHEPDFLGAGLRVKIPEPMFDDLALALDYGAAEDRPHELRYTNYSCIMHRERGLALLTAVDIDGENARRLKRGADPWRLDPRIPAERQWNNELYKRNPLDRGHLVRRLDPVWGAEAEQAERDTFFWTNCAPQHSQLNQKTWLGLEDHILDAAQTHGFRAVVFSGPVFSDTDPEYRGARLPQAFWKVVVMPVEENGGLRLWATAYLLSQASLIENLEFAFGQFGTFQVPVAKIRRLTALDFAPLENADPLASEEAAPYVRIDSPLDIRF